MEKKEKEVESPFLNLGKATRRGMRKCSVCGTSNGTKSLQCKNILCSIPFIPGVQLSLVRKQLDQVDVDAVHGSGVRLLGALGVYSVCSGHGRARVCISQTKSYGKDSTRSTCFGLQCVQNQNTHSCHHGIAATKCRVEAVALAINMECVMADDSSSRSETSRLIQSLQIPYEMHSKLWYKCMQYGVTTVQRVDATTFVVRCSPSTAAPLGFMHVNLNPKHSSTRRRGCKQCECYCQYDPTRTGEVSEEAGAYYCEHISACLIAIACDNELCGEFGDLFTSKVKGKKSVSRWGKDGVTMKTSPALVRVKEGENWQMFEEWLCFVTERINKSMHYTMPGIGVADPLVFHVPTSTFHWLLMRIEDGAHPLPYQHSKLRKKRLPNTMSFVRVSGYADPLTHVTWQIMSQEHVHAIFNNTKVPLLLEQNFTDVPCASENLASSGEKYQKVTPHTLTTYMKIGRDADGHQHVFTITWVPDMFPESGVGEMRVKFQFGHKFNGRSVTGPQSSQTE